MGGWSLIITQGLKSQNGYSATQTPTPNTILPLDDNAQFPASTIKTSQLIFANYNNSSVNFSPSSATVYFISGWQVEVTVPAGNPDVLIEIGAMINYKNTYGAHLHIYKGSNQISQRNNMLYHGTQRNSIGAFLAYKDTSVAEGTYIYKIGLSPAGSVANNLSVESSFIKATILNT